jgi:two-component system chemotaxis response regulator CheY
MSNLSSDPIKILVADDSAVFRKLVEEALSNQRFQLLFAKTGPEAMQLLVRHDPALVIVDWMMPDLTGLELCIHIRERNGSRYTYVIILTGKSETACVVQGLAAGADDYLKKPFDGEELLARVGVGTRIIELHQEIAAQSLLLKELALTDGLTGLPNRRAIDEWASRQLKGAARYGFSFWVAVADLDYFKAVNDSYGHEAGDTVLKKFAHILKSHSRSSDICGRMGREEFVVVLTHITEANALAVTNKIRKELAALIFTSDGARYGATASFGLAGFEGSGAPSFDELSARADGALYSAKRLGRNRVELAGRSGIPSGL